MESWNVHEIEESTRLDVYLAAKLSNVSRARIQRLIAGRDVSVNGAPAKPNTKLRSGDHISISIPDARPLTHIGPEEIDLDVVYEDPDLIVINKAKGMVVHPAPGSERGTLVNALLARIGDLSGIGGALRPGIVHRLDKDTSGLIVVAKNDFAHESLSRQIRNRTAVRKYHALLWGRVPFKHAVIDAPIIRHPGDRKRMTVFDDHVVGGYQAGSAGEKAARPAITELRALEQLAEFSWVEAILQTGRTHQIRVHCSFAGYPVVGDAVYGGLRRISADLLRGAPLQKLNAMLAGLHGQALHAHCLSFDHPRTRDRLQFHAPLPSEVAELVDYLRRLEEAFEF